jgi:hypothetical protein
MFGFHITPSLNLEFNEVKSVADLTGRQRVILQKIGVGNSVYRLLCQNGQRLARELCGVEEQSFTREYA